MNYDLFDIFVKHFSIYFSIGICFIKIPNIQNIKPWKKLVLLFSSLTLTILQCLLQYNLQKHERMLIIYLLYVIILSNITKQKFSNSIIIEIISIAISYALSTLSYIIVFGILLIFKIENSNLINCIFVLLTASLTVLLTFGLFNIKRIKYGLPFIKNKYNSDFFDIIILVTSTIIIFMYFFLGFFDSLSPKHLTYAIAFFTIATIIIIQKVITYYHKQKLQTQALKDYENELSETKQKLQTAINEKQKLVKSNHEFYHRQEALNKKLDDLMKQQTALNSTEFGEEYANILDRINSLSNEYSIKTKSLPTLVKTNIVEIDDMLSYMQSECEKNNIEFILKVDCDLNFILENYISKSQLETLLGDLIRNAIIAIDHSSNDYKSIMVIFGIKDEAYELCIFDSGIPFEINTLLNLGLQPASTHTNEGGTGIGFITTFETINSCNASFIINENTNSNYSKSIEIKFDNKHEYIIISDRKEKITELNQSNRKIILK